MDTTLRSSLPPSTSTSTASVANGAHAAVDRAAEQVKPVIDRAAELAHKAVDKAANIAAPTADWVSQQAENLRATQQKAVDETCKYVQANPLKSLGMALAAGFLISRILK